MSSRVLNPSLDPSKLALGIRPYGCLDTSVIYYEQNDTILQILIKIGAQVRFTSDFFNVFFLVDMCVIFNFHD